MSPGAEVAELTAELEAAHADVHRLECTVTATQARAQSLTPDDPGALSGTRRKPNRRADARRFSAYDREAGAVLALSAARRRVTILEKRLETARHNETTRAGVTPELIATAKAVRTDTGWHEVVRVSAKSVTVRTPWSWNDRIALAKILEVTA